MGLFSSKQIVGTLILYQYPNRELVLSSNLNTNMTTIAFAFYFGKTVYDLGNDLGTQLWKEIFALASEMWEIVQNKEGPPLEERKIGHQTAYTVVPSSSELNPLTQMARLVQKGDVYFCETKATPRSYPNLEHNVMEGCKTVAVHLFNYGANEGKFYLPIVLMGQCNWYEENGFPSITQINAAPYQGVAAMMQIASQA